MRTKRQKPTTHQKRKKQQYTPLALTFVLFLLTVASDHLVVTGTVHAISSYVGEEVVLNCSVDFNFSTQILEEVKWKRTDQEVLVLLYADGEVHSDSTDDRYRGRAEFFMSEISKGNFSLKLKDVKPEDKGEYICEAYSGSMSANTTAVLLGLGKSN